MNRMEQDGDSWLYVDQWAMWRLTPTGDPSLPITMTIVAKCNGPFNDAYDCPVHNPRLRKDDPAMSKKTIEGRIEDYRIRNDVPADLDELLVDTEAEIYRLRREVRVLEGRQKKAAPTP